MTDDTDTAEREDEAPAASLPLIDTFAALKGELAAKEDRIERLESELQREYLEPAEEADGEAEPTEAAAESADSDASDDEPRSHEDWEPATDPLNDTGAVEGNSDHAGVSAEAPTSAADADPTETEPGTAADDSGLKPVRTAGNRSADAGARNTSPGSATDEPAERPTERQFGVTMQTSSNLTGGSLRSSANGVRAGRKEESGSDNGDRPDPTADRGERLSLLARRAEIRNEAAVVETFVSGIEALDDVTREMLAHYREAGDAAPVDAHVAAGGSGERQYAYARNRTLRKAGVIEHDSAGRYRYALPALVAEAFDGSADTETITDTVEAIESETGLAE
ncbi:hypothetical protein [Halolamina salifodinae]|uniref:Winged helix domain-containing protein n=1 Tax=Halolamina salifodinae TaxID=1202767 RepID=A0A8T4GYR3_9EURY|nr:hypothetical protein [Halolamina salifodinae]MBP1987402.1 hypothetical protein [Halolamina salifodinae]